MPSLKPHQSVVLIAAALLAAAAVYWWWAPGPSDAVATSDGQGSVRAVHSASSDARSGTSGALMASDAMGLTMDAARLFELGFGGGLVIDHDTRVSIDAVLNSMPQEPSPQDMDRLERNLRQGLPHADAEKVLKLFKDYRAYATDVRQEMQPQGIPKNLQEANAIFDQLDSVKRRHFDDATASALFGPYDGYARLTMQAMFVQQDASLTPQQKTEQLDALRAKLPPDQQSLIPQSEPSAAAEPKS